MRLQLIPLAILGLALPLAAHHGDAGRYEEESTVITGTVVELQLIVPHSIIVLAVTDANGKTVNWQAELGSRPIMTRDFGWTKDTLKQGDRVTLTGRKVKSGAPYMNLTERASVVLTDSGKEIFRTGTNGGDAGPAPAAKPPAAGKQ